MISERGVTHAEQIIEYDIFEALEFLPPEQRELLEQARNAMDRAYAPYSRFHVGAAVRLASGLIVPGSNCENAAYGSTICAERAALLAVNNMGFRTQVRAIAVMATGEDFETTTPVAPCGACRQVVKEFSDLAQIDVPIITSGLTGPIHRYRNIDMLLPHSFGPADLVR